MWKLHTISKMPFLTDSSEKLQNQTGKDITHGLGKQEGKKGGGDRHDKRNKLGQREVTRDSVRKNQGRNRTRDK